MANWPLEGGVTGIVLVDRNLRGILRRGGELAVLALTKAEAKELYPQLATAGARKVSFGTVTLEYPGGSPEATAKEVEHKLGTTPVAVAISGEGYDLFVSRTFTATKFTAGAHIVEGAAPGAGVKVKASWIAIG